MAKPFPAVAAIVVLTAAWSVCATTARGQELRWQPAGATDNVICMPGSGDCGEREIILSSGGVMVTLFFEVSGWDTAGGGHPGDSSFFFGSFQGTVDSSTYQGGIAGNPGTVAGQNLVPVGQPSMGFEGAYQALEVCTSDLADPVPNIDWLSRCTGIPGECGAFPAGCIYRSDFVFYDLDATCAVSTATIDYSWSCASTDCREDPRDGTRFYTGTLLLDVPAGAKGTYNVNFVDDANFTLWAMCGSGLIHGQYVVPAQITIQTGQCCYSIGVDDLCEDNLTQAECESRPAPRLPIDPGGSCAVDGCCECLSDTHCDDGNQCTDDSCVDCVCQTAESELCGQCCFGIGTPGQGCMSYATESECNAQPGRHVYTPGETCAIGCCECHGDSDCGYENPCEVICWGCRCWVNNPLTPVEPEFCCDPQTGDLEPMEDGDPCTWGTCDYDTGEVTHTWIEPCPGRCCYGYGEETGLLCDDELTKADCDAIQGVTVWTSHETCSGDNQTDCGPPCPAGSCDDGDPCTIDDCDADDGSCTNWLSYVEGAECCNPLTGEVAVINDGDACTSDVCDADTGDVTHDPVSPGTDCIAPQGSRYLAVSPAPGMDPIALLVTGDSEDPLVSCVFEYVQADGTLGPDPVYQLPQDWGTVDIHADEIIPETTYHVHIDDGTRLSDPVAVTTWLWADVNNDAYVNVADIQLILLGIQGKFLFASVPNLDLISALGATCIPQGIVNITDVQMAKQRVQGRPYLDLGCPLPCP